MGVKKGGGVKGRKEGEGGYGRENAKEEGVKEEDKSEVTRLWRLDLGS